MKVIVSAAATLALKNGEKFTLTPGIRDSDSFPEEVKNHWAFASYVQPVDEADLAKEESAKNIAMRLSDAEKEIDALKSQVSERDATIFTQNEEIDALKSQVSEAAKDAKKQPATK